MKSIYIAAPLFTPLERELNLHLARVLEEHFSVFLPQRDGMLLAGRDLTREQFMAGSAEVFLGDVRAINECDVLFAVLDGRVVDEGVAFEIGYAHARGKVCVGYHTDSRVLLPHGLNPMIECSLSERFADEAQIRAWMTGF